MVFPSSIAGEGEYNDGKLDVPSWNNFLLTDCRLHPKVVNPFPAQVHQPFLLSLCS